MDRQIRDVMTTRVVTVRQDTPFKMVAALLAEHRISAVPVVDGLGRVVGVVSEADLLPKEFRVSRTGLLGSWRHRGERALADATAAEELMSAPAITVEPDRTVPDAARIMHRRGVKRLPVVDARGTLVGIVSRRDLLRAFLRDDEEIRREIADGIIRRTLWLPGEAARVDVRDGVVTLHGTLEHRGLCSLLVELVGRVEGVVDIRDEMTAPADDPADPSDSGLASLFPPRMLA